MDVLAPGVSVRSLGDASDGNISDAEIGEYLASHRKLAQAAIDQHEIGTIGELRVVVSGGFSLSPWGEGRDEGARFEHDWGLFPLTRFAK
jgi:hypothetical protein